MDQDCFRKIVRQTDTGSSDERMPTQTRGIFFET